MAVVLIIGLVTILVVIVLLWIGSSLRRQRRALLERLRPQGIMRHDAANYFGKGSAGVGQMRGSGILVLTLQELHFEMLVPRKEITIPLHSIIRVDTPKSFAGKSDLRRLLVVTYTDEHGEEEQVGWSVQDVEDWVRDIGQVD